MKHLINKSVYGTIGYINSQEDLNKLHQLILLNHFVLKEYKQIIVATNYGDKKDIYEPLNNHLWSTYFNNVVCLTSPINRGHNFGTADLDNMIFDYCKEHDVDWLCKSANDIYLDPSIFSNKIGESDFYYLNGIGFGGMYKYDFEFNRIIEEDFYPQTNFYFINVKKVDWLNSKAYIDLTYEAIQSNPNYNGKIWEYFDDWSCESFLRMCVQRNNLKIEHILERHIYENLLKYVATNQIHDPSHKNIKIQGICHFHNINEPIVCI